MNTILRIECDRKASTAKRRLQETLFQVYSNEIGYEDKGFVETNGSGEIILTSNAATMFILDQEQRLFSQPFD